MKEIKIFGVSLDLEDNEPIAITKQVNDIAELKDRQSDFSNNIRIPWTNRNKVTLGHANIVASETRKPYVILNVEYLSNGSTILPNATLVLEESEDDYVNASIISGVYSFFKLLDGKSIRDLDLTAFNHLWTAEAASNLIANTEGVLYPIVQTGPLLPTGSEVDINYQVPCIFYKNIVDQIFLEAGYKKTGPIFSGETYNNILVQCNNTFEHSDEFINARSCVVGINTFELDEVLSVIAGGSMNRGPELVKFNQEETYTTYTLNDITVYTKTGYKDGSLNCFKADQFSYVSAGTYKVEVNVRLPFAVRVNTSTVQVKTVLRKNGLPVSIDEADYSSDNFTITARQHTGIELELSAGDVLDVTIEVNESNSLARGTVLWPYPELPPGVTIEDFLDFGSSIANFEKGLRNLSSKNCYFKVTVLEEFIEGEELSIPDLLPDISQTDFIKAMAHKFGLIFQPDNLTKVIDCRQFKEIALSEGIDWSSKLDRSKKVSLLYRFEKYGQKNYFRYQEGEDLEKKELGDSFFEINDKNLEPEVDIIELPFQASAQTKVLGDIECASVPLFTLNDALEWERQDIGPRIFLLKREVRPLVYKDKEVTVDMGIRPVPIAYFDENDDSLHFERLLENNYTELISSLQKCKIVRAYFILTEADILNLDFFQKVYVEYFGLHFYLNKVEEYTGEGSTLCELVRI